MAKVPDLDRGKNAILNNLVYTPEGTIIAGYLVRWDMLTAAEQTLRYHEAISMVDDCGTIFQARRRDNGSAHIVCVDNPGRSTMSAFMAEFFAIEFEPGTYFAPPEEQAA